MKVDYSRLPEYMQDGTRMYIEQGVQPGDFLCAVFSNELVEAYGRADSTNTAAMKQWASFLYNEAPRGSWGSRKLVREWCEHQGLAGIAKRIEDLTLRHRARRRDRQLRDWWRAYHRGEQ